MSAAIASNIDPSTIKVVALYDEVMSGHRAKAVFDRVAFRAESGFQLQFCLWRIDILEYTHEADEALADAMDADLIMIVMHPETGAVPTLLHWLERWALHRNVPDAALAALLLGALNATASDVSIFDLQQLAARHGLAFLCERSAEPSEDSRQLVEILRQRQQLVTPTLRNIMHRTDADDPHRHWGINE